MNLPPGMDWKALKDAFSSVGEVELCLLVEGMTMITFSAVESAVSAVETYDDRDLNGHRISVKFNDGSLSEALGGTKGGKKTILVTNLPVDLHWRNLKSVFSVMGKVDLCRVRDCKAEITFRSAAGAQNAVAAYGGGSLNGNRIGVRFFDAANGVILVN
jgi:RNA recognition motif-containing protein